MCSCDDDHDVVMSGRHIYAGGEQVTVSRRDALLALRQGPGKTTGMKFKALVRYENTWSTETLTLLPIHPLHVVIRMQASQACYSSTNQLNLTNRARFAAVAGHGGVGVVEEVGRLVKRVKVGDQVMPMSDKQRRGGGRFS